MLNLSDAEKRDIVSYIEAGKPLPEKYRFLLFEKKRQVELLWNGKSQEVCQTVLPFQTIECVDEPRSEEHKKNQLELFDETGRQIKGWTNKLIWGDNKYILSSLKNGSLRGEIEKQGGIKLIYIDPPFDVGADFSMNIEVGDGESYDKKPNILEEIAYRDTWGLGQDSFLSMIYERLVLMRDLLADDGSIYVHCDYRVHSSLKSIMDEIFGLDNFRNEIVWWYKDPSGQSKEFYKRKHDTILFYVKTNDYIFNVDDVRVPYSEGTLKQASSGAISFGRVTQVHEKGKLREDVWDIPILNSQAKERLGYPTQKPEILINTIIKASSNEGDLVCDFFNGSGTTASVCEKLNRKWICSDLGKFSIHTTRKRLISVQRELKKEGKDYRAFEILNLGKYQREHFISNDKNQKDNLKEKQFLRLILDAYNAQEVQGFKTFDGKKNNRLVSIGPVNQPLSRLHTEEVIKECLEHRITKVDILGFEYEMGLFPTIQEEARSKGIDLAYKQIPKEVFDKRAVEKGEVVFHDVAYIEMRPIVKGNMVSVELTDFCVFYDQGLLESTGESLKNSQSKVIVDSGQIVKVSKDKNGIVSSQALTKKWEDWIDYWSVDFDFESRKEIIRVAREDKPNEFEEKWTGDYVFENEWQSFRTKGNRKLELISSPKEILGKSKIKIAVKVIDIFGNDTMKVLEVKI